MTVMRTPSPEETPARTTALPATVVEHADSGVWAYVVDLGGAVRTMTVHVREHDGHVHCVDATMTGRTHGDVRSHDQLVAQARRAVAEQADYRAAERGTLIHESIPREVATAAGLHSWIGISDDERRRTAQVAQDWADERVEETGARFADVRLINGEARVSLHYDTPPAATAEQWAALDNGSGEVARSFSFTEPREEG